ncbi:MAG TPA: hypothetical protein VF542_00165 [Jatrophihabitans sp.]
MAAGVTYCVVCLRLYSSCAKPGPAAGQAVPRRYLLAVRWGRSIVDAVQ